MNQEKLKIALIPTLVAVFGAVVYFQYFATSDGSLPLETPEIITPGAQTEISTDVKEALNAESPVPIELNLNELIENNPFARTKRLQELMDIPIVQQNIANGLSPRGVAVSVTQPSLRLPPDSLQALFGSANGWSAVIASKIVRVGDEVFDDSGAVLGKVTAIDESGVQVAIVDLNVD